MKSRPTRIWRTCKQSISNFHPLFSIWMRYCFKHHSSFILENLCDDTVLNYFIFLLQSVVRLTCLWQSQDASVFGLRVLWSCDKKWNLCGEVVRVSLIYEFCGTSVVHSLMITTSLSPQAKASISKGQDSIRNQLALLFEGSSLATQ